MNIGTLTVILQANTVGLSRAAIAMRQLERTTGRATAGMTASMKATEAAAVRANAATVALGRSLTQFVSLPLAIIGGVAVTAFAKFEYSIAKVTGLISVAANETRIWSDQIREMSKTTGMGPNQLAEGLYFVATAGFRGAEAMNILTLAAKASLTGLGETKGIVDTMTSVVNAYGASNITAAESLDVLIATVREGKAEAGDLVTSIGVVIPIASKLGVSFDQVGAAMAAMTRTGTKSSTSAVQLRQILNSLLKPSKRAENTIHMMGTSFAELRTELQEKGLLSTLKTLDALTKKYGDHLMARLFPNIRALSGVVDIMGANFLENEKIFARMANAGGELDIAFAAVANTVKVQLQKEVASTQSAMLNLGESISSAVIPIIKGLNTALIFLINIFSKLPEFAKTIVLLVIALGPAILLFKGIIAIHTGVVASFAAMSVAVTGFAGPFAAIMLPLIGTIAAVALAIGGLLYHFLKASDATKEVNKAISEGTAAMKKEEIQVNGLVNTIISQNTTLDQKAVAMQRLNDLSFAYTAALAQEAVVTGEANAALQQYLESMKNKGVVTAAVTQMQELQNKMLQDTASGKDREGGFMSGMLEGFTAESAKAKRAIEYTENYNKSLKALGKEIVQRIPELKELNAAYDSAGKLMGKEMDNMASNKLAGQIRTVTNELKQQKKVIADLEAKNAIPDGFNVTQRVADLDSLISKYNEYYKTLTQRAPLAADIMDEAALKAQTDFNNKMEEMANLSQVMGVNFNQANEELKVYKDYIESLAGSSSFSDLSKDIENMIRVTDQLTMEGIFTDLERGLKENEISAGLLGKSFNKAKEDASLLEAALSAIAKSGVALNTALQSTDMGDMFGAQIEELVSSLKRKELMAKWAEETEKAAEKLIELRKAARDAYTFTFQMNEAIEEGTLRMEEYASANKKVRDEFSKTLSFMKSLDLPEEKEQKISTGSLPELNRELKELQSLQEKSIDATVYAQYGQQIEYVTEKIKVFKGEIEDTLESNLALMQAWKTAGNALVSIFQELGQMIGGAFGEAIDKVTPYITLLTKVITFMKAVGVLESLNTAKKVINTTVTAVNTSTILAGIPAVAAATVAQMGLAQANTAVAVTGAAASVSWIPIVGIGLAIAGVIALLAVLSSSKNKGANLANGGIIPDGYPNDTYKTNLSSQEAVIPLERLPQLIGIGAGSNGKQVEFFIEGRYLKGILADANMMGGLR